MKKNFLLTVALVFGSMVSAQTASDFGKIPLVVYLPEDFPSYQYKTMENKLTQIVSHSGMASYGYGNFVIYPKLSIQSIDVVEGGMQNITVANISLNLFIEETSTGRIFSSYAVDLKGSGKGEDKAIANAINQIKPSTSDFKLFIQKGKEQILAYYSSKCNSILADIDNLHKKKDYEGALALAMSIPEEVPSCYAKAQQKSLAIYTAYQSQLCSQNIQKATSFIAQKKYGEALDILAYIDNAMPCFGESKKLISSIESKVKAEDQKRWNYLMKLQNDAVSLEKHRINAIKTIATEYYKSQRRDIYIIK